MLLGNNISVSNLIIDKMKRIFLLLLLVISTNCMAQLETGLLVSGGFGNVVNTSLQLNNPSVVQVLKDNGRYSLGNQFNAALGYRFRLHNPKHNAFFYDFDILAGLKTIKFKTFHGDKTALLSSSASDLFCPVSITASFNYKIVKELYIGAGVAPTAIFASKTMFDIPVIARVGYNINNKIEFAVNYQYSMPNAFKTDEYKGGRFSEWNISVYIPFTLSGRK